jgi:hypothetical protein
MKISTVVSTLMNAVRPILVGAVVPVVIGAVISILVAPVFLWSGFRVSRDRLTLWSSIQYVVLLTL